MDGLQLEGLQLEGLHLVQNFVDQYGHVVLEAHAYVDETGPLHWQHQSTNRLDGSQTVEQFVFVRNPSYVDNGAPAQGITHVDQDFFLEDGIDFSHNQTMHFRLARYSVYIHQQILIRFH